MAPEQNSDLHQFFEANIHKGSSEISAAGHEFEINQFRFKIEQPLALIDAFDIQKKDKPLIFMVSGPTESGKSTFGQTLAGDHIATRFKILKHVRELLETDVFTPPPELTRDNPSGYLTYVKTLPQDQIDSIGTILVNTTSEKLNQWDTPIATIETISHPWVIKAFKNSENVRSVSIFLDPYRTLRIKRGANKEHVSLEEAKATVDAKDQLKSNAGLWECRELAEIYVQNSGIIDEYCRFIRELGAYAMETTRPFTGTPFEYK